jgi:DNA gyrase inhibitor GyrI
VLGSLHLSTALEGGTYCIIDQKAAATDRPRIVNKILRSWDYTRRKTPMSVPVVHVV